MAAGGRRLRQARAIVTVLEVALVDFHSFVVHFVCFLLLLIFLLVFVILMMPSVIVAALVPRLAFLLECPAVKMCHAR